MAIAFEDEIGTLLYIKCGTKNHMKLIIVNKVASAVGQDVCWAARLGCKAVIEMHAYTGCNTVGAFTGKGKVQALELLREDREICDTFTKLRQEWDLSLDLMNSLESLSHLCSQSNHWINQ